MQQTEALCTYVTVVQLSLPVGLLRAGTGAVCVSASLRILILAIIGEVTRTIPSCIPKQVDIHGMSPFSEPLLSRKIGWEDGWEGKGGKRRRLGREKAGES